MTTWKLKRTRQCAKCPWRKDVDPFDIPNGYSHEKHEALRSTIADPADAIGQLTARTLRVMACHEMQEAHCIGWLVNQAEQGNNIALRMRLRSCENYHRVVLVGAQHESFEDTLR